jgi:hypothetical protein
MNKLNTSVGNCTPKIIRSFIFCILHNYGNQFKEDQMGRTWSARGRKEKCIQNFGRKTQGKRPVVRPRHREANNIKTEFQEVD